MSGTLPTDAHVTYNQQYRRCGRPACPRCADAAPGHGPYWYAYWREGGRLRSRYIGKTLPPGANAGLPIGAETESPGPRTVPMLSAVAPLRVQSLGRFRVWRGGEPIPDERWGRRKAAALFKCLLDAPGLRLPREGLLELLWPEAAPEVAANNLKVTTHHLRRILDRPDQGARYLRVEGDLLLLDPAPGTAPPADWWDVAAFTAALSGAMAGQDSSACESALSLYGGPYLPEETYAEWTAERRDALQARHLALRWHLASLYLAQDRHAAALPALQAILADDPCHEEAADALMQLHAAAGRHAEATRVYRQLVQALEQDLGLGPSARTRAIHQQLLASRHTPPAAHGPTVAIARLQRAGTAPRPVQPPLQALSEAPLRAPLVGRDAERAALGDHVRAMLNGHGALLLIGGEEGVGKSRLLTSFLRDARAAGALILAGRAYRQEGQLPYGPLLEALRGYVQAQPAALVREQCIAGNGAWARVLAGLIPELQRAIPELPAPAALEPQAERHRLFAAIGGLLQEIARTQPLVIGLEDLQWADATTVQMLHYLGRSCAELPLLLAGTYRPEELDTRGPLAELVEIRRREQPTTALAVTALNEAGSRALIEALLAPAPVDPEIPASIWTKAHGNPFFVEELVSALSKAGQISLRDGRWQISRTGTVTVPATIRALIAERVDRLEPAAGNLLRLCAVLGKSADYALLRQMNDLGEERLLAALEAALAAGLLEEHAQGGAAGYAFRHPLVPEALYQSIPVQRRALLHQRAGEALLALYGEQAGERAPDLAWHFGQAGSHAQAARFAMTAGAQAAAAYATPEALSHYQAAREHLARALADDTVLALLEERSGDLRLLAGAFEEARQHFAQAHTLERDPVRRAELARKEGVSWARRGVYDRALAAFDQADTELVRERPAAAPTSSGPAAMPVPTEPRALPAQVRAAIALSRGEVLYRRGDAQAAEIAAGRALSALQRVSQSGVAGNNEIELARARVDSLLGNVALDRGDHLLAESCYRRALAIRERAGDQQGIAESWTSRGDVAYDRRDYAEAERCYRSSLAMCERTGDQWGVAAAWNGLALAAREQDDYAGAEERFRHVLAIRERIEDQQGVANACQNLGSIAMVRGDYGRAAALYGRGVQIAEHIGDEQGVAISCYNLGRVAFEAGDPRSAAMLCRYARRLAARIGFSAVEARAALEGARCHLRLGQPRRAAIALAHGRALVQRYRLARTAVSAALVAAELSRADEACRPEIARARTLEAAAGAVRLAVAEGLRLEEAQARRLLALALLAGGAETIAEAVHELRAAVAAFAALGAAVERARAQLLLAETLFATSSPESHGALGIQHEETGALLAEARQILAIRGTAEEVDRVGRLAAQLETCASVGGVLE